MRSDVIIVKTDGSGVKEALSQAEAVAVYKSLSKKDALHLRLITEEMMGLLQGLTGETEAKFYIEDEEHEFRLHLITETAMDSVKRRKLLESSTSGKNEAAKGVMGKIRDLFQQAFEPLDDGVTGYYNAGWINCDIEPISVDYTMYENTWSLKRYRDSLGEYEKEKPEWDELEKSIVANLADEVKIDIRKNRVELIIYKKI